jgi:hypothetical protein
MPLFFHLEGEDRCGKSTVSDLFTTAIYLQCNEIVTQVKSKYPPKPLQKTTSHESVEMFCNMQLDKQFKHLSTVTGAIVMDRSWVGENVYGVKYRGRQKLYQYNGEPEKNIIILFYDSPERVLSRDDGKSTFHNTIELSQELDLFKTAVKDEPYVIYADASKYGEKEFHNKLTKMMIDYYKSYKVCGKITEQDFIKIADKHNFEVKPIC